MAKEIILWNSDLIPIVDDEDFEYLRWFKWRLNTSGYARRGRRIDGKYLDIYIHLEIAKVIGLIGQIDHKNRDKLDNRRTNLRQASHSQNRMNIDMFSNNTSGHKGIELLPSNRWRARIRYDNRLIHLGVFNSAIEAAKAYDRAAIRYFGEFAALNFPENKYGNQNTSRTI